MIACPSCGMETKLYHKPKLPDPDPTPEPERAKISVNVLGFKPKFFVVPAIVVACFFLLVTFISIFGEGTTESVIGGIVALAAIVLTAAWVLFPLIVHRKLNDILTVLEKIERKP